MGPLQRQLRKGEYGFFKYSPMFESDFVQISKHGGPVEITNEEQIVTVGMSFTSPVLLMPDVLLVARPVYLPADPPPLRGTRVSPQRKVKYELSRLFPLRLVKISIHDAERQQLKFRLASGRTFYLQLCPESYRREYLFDSWTRIIQLLWPPSDIMSAMKEEVIETSRIRSSPPPRPKAPSPKPPVKSTTAWSELTFTNSLAEDKETRKISTAKSPTSLTKAQNPGSSSRAAQEAELVRPPPSQAWKEERAERNPSHRSQAGEKVRRESSHPTRSFKRSFKESHSSRSKSGQRDANRKPSKLLSLIQSYSWGSSQKVNQGTRSQSKERK
ncbi:Golgi-associated RAB2B interactor protein 3-like [Heteronotia binoei]|uniref:Golgi-associated RAB2B interactor protein 3-like n=1 Tax=Heteronotia binoei TaxID=13085 RepID=UPI00292FE219|nr:Golgi-associated RAB2B interactor protein 3-like [Heteronotia binoei]